jgi:hypothetical protein
VLLGGQNRFHMNLTQSRGLGLPGLGLLYASFDVGASAMMGTALKREAGHRQGPPPPFSRPGSRGTCPHP